MREGRLTDDESPANQRLTVPEAAAALGITEGAVRGRVKRRTLSSQREGGTVYVILEGVSSSAKHDKPVDSPADQSELVEVLREQLAAERQAHSEARRIIMSLSQANAEQARTIREIEAPASQEATAATETVEEASDREESRAAAGGAQGGARRGWWKRIFGG